MDIVMRLPDFIGVGAPRSGTTWLAQLLNQHPEVYLDPNFKEIHFFDKNYQRGLAWYSRFFKDQPTHRICGEFTPSYMNREANIQRIQHMNPHVKIIVNLRNPVKRAFSHYMQRKRFTHNLGSFECIIEANSDQILDFGEYGRQLTEILSLFPREQVHIIIFEDLVKDPQQCLTELLSFLNLKTVTLDLDQAHKNAMTGVHFLIIKKFIRGVRALGRRYALIDQLFFRILPGKRVLEYIRKWNLKAIPDTKEQMSPEAQKMLTEHYARDTQQLEMLLDRKLNWLQGDA